MMLMRLLQAIESATGIKPVPQVITGTRGIAYDWEVSFDNGSMTTANLSVRVISTANDEVLMLSDQIKKALISFGDGSPVPGVASAFINGQSHLPVDEVKQVITKYQFIYRSE